MPEAVENPSACRNCGAPVASKYCPECGQGTSLHPLSVWQFVHEIISHYVAVEGKLWRTLATLTLRPGRLTLEYLAGRRQRYIIPLRLYLTASFLFFAVAQWSFSGLDPNAIKSVDLDDEDVKVLAPVLDQHAPKAAKEKAAEASSAPKKPEEGNAADAKSIENKPEDDKPITITFPIPGNSDNNAGAKAFAKSAFARELVEEEFDKCRQPGADCPIWKRILAPAMTNLLRDPDRALERFTERFHHSMSYAMFCLLPIFAGLLAFAYRRRHMYYGEHLVFALHVHSFWFLLALAVSLIPYVGGEWVGWAYAAYGFWALQRVYGGRWWVTFLRGSFVSILYIVIMGLGTAGLTLVLLST